MAQKKNTPKYFYLIMVLLPVLFLILLESGLRIFNYGKDLSVWVKVNENLYGVNPNLAFRYFYNTKNVPNSIQDVFSINKSRNTFRIFVLGGSSAAGFPYMPLGSFSRYIQRRLELFYPDKNIEVVNLSLTAVNSYTIRDIIPDVLDQKPDLVLVYAGHNEYYGALGVGSMESLGSLPWLVNSMLFLNKFKTVELLRDFSKSVAGMFPNENSDASGTLMSRMAEEQSIKYDSDLYYSGIEQFESNIAAVIHEATSRNIPVMLSTLASNLKDQEPFVSENGKQSANSYYHIADSLFGSRLNDDAEKYFRLAKDYDMLRFRAPEDINNIIKSHSFDQLVYLVDCDSLLNSESVYGIAGNDLFIDHLHPNLTGYQKLGKYFVDNIIEKEFLPPPKTSCNLQKQDSIARAVLYFSKLDSVISDYRIIMLRNDWPFIKDGVKVNPSFLLKRKNYLDSLAFNVLTNRLPWALAQKKAAEFHLRAKDYNSFTTQMGILINQYPFIYDYYDYSYMELMKANQHLIALKFLKLKHEIRPDEFTSKWIGIINLNQNNVNESIKYLEASLRFNPTDPQTLYNLAGAYAKMQEYKKAYNTISSCLNLQPDYQEAIIFKNSLQPFIQ